MAGIRNYLSVREDKDKKLLYYSFYAYFSSGMMVNILGSILPYLGEKYGFSYEFRGNLSSLTSIGNLFALWLSVFMPALIGRKNSTVIQMSGIVLGLLLISSVGNPVLLIIAFLLLGLGRGTITNTVNVVVGDAAINKGSALNILHASFALGAVISPFILSMMSEEKTPVTLLLIAALSFIAILLFAFSHLSNHRIKREKKESVFPSSFSFWNIALIMFFYLAVEQSLLTWLVTYFKDAGILSVKVAQMMSGILWLTILLGRLGCVYLSERIDRNLLILVLALILTISFTFMIVFAKPAVIIISMLIVGLSMSGIYPTTLSTMEERYTESGKGTGLCIAFASLGSIIMPSVIGYISEKYGIKAGMATIFVALFCLLSLMLVKLLLAMRAEKEQNRV